MRDTTHNTYIMNKEHPVRRRDNTIMPMATSVAERGWERAKGAVGDSIESAKDFGGDITDKTISATGDTYNKAKGTLPDASLPAKDHDTCILKKDQFNRRRDYAIMQMATSVAEKGWERAKGVVGDSYIEAAKDFGGDVDDKTVSATDDTYKKAKRTLVDASLSSKESISGAASSAEESVSVLALSSAQKTAEYKTKSALDVAYELFGDHASTGHG
jgi:hypothetical protein